MIRFLLDTNICIYVLENRPQALRIRFDEEAPYLAISTVTSMELAYGVEKSARPQHNRAVVDGLIARLELLAYDAAAARHTGAIRADLAKAGTPIGPYDAMIAGSARAHGLTLVTNNIREFERVPGLLLENWLH